MIRTGEGPIPPQRDRPIEEYARAATARRGLLPELLFNAYFLAGFDDPPLVAERERLIRGSFQELLDVLSQSSALAATSRTCLPPILEDCLLGGVTLPYLSAYLVCGGCGPGGYPLSLPNPCLPVSPFALRHSSSHSSCPASASSGVATSSFSVSPMSPPLPTQSPLCHPLVHCPVFSSTASMSSLDSTPVIPGHPHLLPLSSLDILCLSLCPLFCHHPCLPNPLELSACP